MKNSMSLQVFPIYFHRIFHTRCLILVILCAIIHTTCDLLRLTTSCSAEPF